MSEPATTTPLPPLVGDGTTVGSLSADQVAAAADAVRAHCGWHIAPVITSEVVLDSEGGRILHLPTLALVEVISVEDLSGDAPVEVTGYRASPAGMLSRNRGCWPAGFSTVRVTFRHGFEQIPAGLLPVLGTVGSRRVKRESLGGRSVELDDYEAQLHHAVLDRYRLEALP